MNFTDTIAAIATPMGEGGIGIVRISGTQANEIALKILTTNSGKKYSQIKDRRVYYGKVVQPESGDPVDEVLFFYAQKPRSYTREDVIEIQAHGGMLVLGKILTLILSHGGRLAQPGEFTMRAFLNGRIDLIQAESIIDLIRAKTDRSQELALAQLTGRTSNRLYQLETELYQILVGIEALLDYPEEGLPENEKETIEQKTEKIALDLRNMASKIDEGRMIREGVNIVIVGRPNVGKSSLLNAFIQQERAIVTDIPGTTRDIIEANFQLAGVPFILTDTAGLRETDNVIEKMGIIKAEKSISAADLVLFVLDGSQPLTDEDRFIFSKVDSAKYLVIINKSDLPTRLELSDLPEKAKMVLSLSSLTRQGFEQLEQKLIDMVGLGNLQLDDRPLLSRVRHRDAVEKAIFALDHFQSGLKSGISEDLLAIDLRSCLAALGEITGKDVSLEVIHRIFETFCIGK